MSYLNAVSLLKRNLLGFNVSDKTLSNALEALKDIEVDETSSNALQIVFNKIGLSAKDGAKGEAKAANSYKPESQKFESASALQMKYEDLKKSSEAEIQRLNNHLKAVMEKVQEMKDKKVSEKSQR